METKKLHTKIAGAGIFDLFIVILSIYVLGSLMVSSFAPLDPQTSSLLDTIDNGICVIFLYDFFRRFFKAEDKMKFMKWGWIDLLASIPALDIFRAGRLFRVIRLLRVLRALKSTKYLVSLIYHNRRHSTLTSVALIAILMTIFSSIAILQLETDPNSNIKTAEDALWWSYVTITTVGYGDKFPVTTSGRLLGAILMTIGVGTFGTLTALMASWFVEGKKEEEKGTGENSTNQTMS